MYVCVCNAVTESQISAAVQAGATRLRDLRSGLGVTVDCGRCARCAHECLRAALSENCPRAAAPLHVRGRYPNSALALEAS